MTTPLHFRLLGGLHIAVPEKPPLRFSAKRAEVLLVYLALNRREHSRETLATLLWDDRPHKQALANLRALLAQLPKGVRPYLKTSRQVVMFKPEAPLWIDSLTFADLLDNAASLDDLAQALDLYTGPFLDGIFVRESRGLEEWTAVIREQLNVKAYESCRQILADELGVEPAQETVRLSQRIAAAKQSSQQSLPTPITPFIGREAELTAMSQQLDQPDCRLLTIVGAGGVGKTRLALQTAHLRQGDYLNGTCFVPLSTVETAVDIPLSIAKSLKLSFQGQAATETQLLHAPADKELLLILDNIEHLLPEAAQFVTRLLPAAPDITLLITSRERLRLPAENCFELAGLTEDESAEKFFVTCARRTLPDFTLTFETQTAMRHICRLVDGLPLGIELAAAWVHMLSCAEIAQEIELNIGFLAAPQQERPERHQSLEAVFEYSWRLLSPPEQMALLKLSVFHNGFTREAARDIAGANLLMLRSLVDKSLLYRANEESDRYGMLAVLRQHVLAKLASEKGAEDAEYASTLDGHSRYYGRFLQTHEPNLHGQSRTETVQLLTVELENCRRAWRTAVARQPLDLSALGDFVEGLYAIYHTSAWFGDGYDLLEAARERLVNKPESAARNVVLSRLLSRLGSLAAHMGQFQLALSHHEDSLQYGREAAPAADLAANYIGLAQVSDILGQLPQAQMYAQKAHDLYEAEGDEEGMVVALRKMASAAQGVGQFNEAAAIYRSCLTICRRANDQHGIARACTGLGNALADLGKFEDARKAYSESLAIYEKMQNLYSIALVLSNIGTIDSVLASQAEARASYEKSYKICVEIGDQAGMGVTLMNIALTYEREDELEKARDLYQQSIRILRQVSYISVLPTALTSLGIIFTRLGDVATGRATLHESVQICQANGLTPLLLEAILGVGKLLQLEGQWAQALSFGIVAAQHPTSNQETASQAEKLAAKTRVHLTPEQIAAAEAWGAERSFSEVVTAVLAETSQDSRE